LTMTRWIEKVRAFSASTGYFHFKESAAFDE